MIFQCTDLERALRSPDLMPDARGHARTCPKCREELALWTEISRTAPGLHEEWDSPELWPRIQAGLSAVSMERMKRSVPMWRRAVAAAAVVTLTATLFMVWRGRQTVVEPPDSRFLTAEALRDVEQTEAAYSRAIERLSVLAGTSLQESSLPVAAVYREKLLLLDSAIADLKTSIDGNKYNVYLQTQLASLYRDKQKTLEEWLANAKGN